MKPDWLDVAIGALWMLILVCIVSLAHSIGYDAGRQSVAPIACEPKCEFVYRNKKLINVTCPDSLGRMP